MSHDPFDDLPDHLREAIREMAKRLQEIDPEQIENMMKQLFGEEFFEKMKEFSMTGGAFTFPIDPGMAKNFEIIMKNFMGTASGFQSKPETGTEVPYYELVELSETEGEIVIDLPGITDVRQVNWSLSNSGLTVFASLDDLIYKVDIPLNFKISTKDSFASIKNSVFILPYSRK